VNAPTATGDQETPGFGGTSLFVAHLWNAGRRYGPHRLTISGDTWSAIEASSTPHAGDLVVDEGMAMPGLVDLHAHFGRGPYAVPIDIPLATGVTTVCSQGDAGEATFDEWLAACSGSATRTLMALNIGSFGEALTDCLSDPRPDLVARTVECAMAHQAEVRMVAANLSERSLGSAEPRAMLAAAMSVAQHCGLPLMLALAPDHVLSIDEQLDTLRAGDVITYCYRSRPWCLFPEQGPPPSLLRALERGVELDTAHGSEAFDLEVARRAVALGFLPAAVSSGLKVAEAGHPDPLPIARVMQRMHSVGMSLDDILTAVTTSPARLLGLDRIAGFLDVGARADLTVLSTAGQRWTTRALVVGGQLMV